MPEYAPARRLTELRSLIESTGGLSLDDLAERLSVSTRTVRRYLEALSAAGEALYLDDTAEGSRWRLMPSAQRSTVTVSTSQLVALYMARRVLDFLRGTGFHEDLEDVFRRLEATLRSREEVLTRHLDRKIFDINEAAHIYDGRHDHVNALVTALLREERLTLRHQKVERGKKEFLFEPYSILVYKKGLYLAGYSHEHQRVRPLSLDSIVAADWRRGDRFEYPEDYDPQTMAAGNFGLIGGPPTKVRVYFTGTAEPFVRRRRWHPSQKFKRAKGGGVEVELEVNGTTELVNWVLSWGELAEVLEPPDVREEVARRVRAAAARYDRPATGISKAGQGRG